jgi:Flp pilus assembly protein TadD
MGVQPLEPPDSFHARHAAGWLELGCADEARAELAQIAPAHRHHPEVLEARWLLCAHEKQWADGLTVARLEMAAAPADAAGWLHAAYALRRMPGGGLVAARAALLPAVEKFPDEPVVPYNLACYACQLSDLAEARRWFQRALATGNRMEIQRMALADPDLQPLWAEIAPQPNFP